jgi:uncharacterized protein YydD (DUF2326 family)
MILNTLFISENIEVKFKLGLNVIVGKNQPTFDTLTKTGTPDTNGIGKTTIIRIISHVLGGPSEGAISSNFFSLNKYWASLQITRNEQQYVISRPLWKPLSDQITLLYLGNLSAFKAELKNRNVHLNSVEDIGFLNNRLSNIDHLKVLSKDEAQNFISRIEEIDYSKSNLKFSALLDFIIRDEKAGFNDIISRIMRKEWTQYRSIQYLFGLPAFVEAEATKLKDQEVVHRKTARLAAEYLKEQKVKDISAIQNQEVKLSQRLKAIQENLSKLNVGESFKLVREKYESTKKQFIEVNSQVSLKETQLRNFKANLSDLKDKEVAISSLIDVKGFYNELIGFFPESIASNFSAYEQFFNSVSDDRKSHYTQLIASLKKETTSLRRERVVIERHLRDLSSKVSNTTIVGDISTLVKSEEQIQQALRSLNRARDKLAQLETANELAQEMETARKLVLKLGKTQEKKDRNKRQKLIQLFYDLVLEVYGTEDGNISFEYTDDSKSSVAGRTKIQCSIPSQNSKGRNHAKICLFDFVWFLKESNTPNYSPEFLIHDGPFSDISPIPKQNMLKLISRMSLDEKKQYIVTANANELPESFDSIPHHKAIILDGNSVEGKLFGEQYE